MSALVYSIIDSSGLITNRSAGEVEPPEGFTVVAEPEDGAYAIGGTLVAGVYTPPHFTAPPAPPGSTSVSPRQARLALLGAGLLDQVQAAVDAAGGATKIAWEYATEIDRHDPLIGTLGTALGLTDAQIDQLFVAASQIP